MGRLSQIFLIVIALAVTLAQGGIAQTREAAPDFSLADINSTIVSLSDYKGRQGVLLFFWTIQCPFCREELNLLNDKYPELSKRGLVVLSINPMDSLVRAARFSKKYSLKYKVLLDQYAQVAMRYRLMGVPTYVLIDKEGNIIYQDNYFPGEEELLRALK